MANAPDEHLADFEAHLTQIWDREMVDTADNSRIVSRRKKGLIEHFFGLKLAIDGDSFL